jgi:hypothetical protein
MGSKILRQGDRYKAKLEKTLADGKVTKQEATAILRDAKDGTFRQVEAHYLSGFVGLDAKKFDPQAHQRLLAFVKTEMVAFAEIAGDTGLPSPRKQPTLTEDSEKKGVTFKPREGVLTVDGIGADDALQGNVGNCYLIAGLASVAKVKPEVLAKNLTASRDGSYTVTFYERKEGQTRPTPVKVKVDGTFAHRGSMLEYGGARSAKELWPLIYEKAYAAWKGSFTAIEGGMSATTLEALTGKKPGFFPVDDALGADHVWKQLQAVSNASTAVVALSKPWNPGQGMVEDHAYSVLGISTKNGERFVTLRNPWGETEPGRDGKNDGIFTMKLSEFLEAFATVEFAKL